MGFLGGFLFAYQRSSCALALSLFSLLSLADHDSNSGFHAVRFLGWSENKREEEKDFAELSQRAREGKPLWGESPQPMWVQAAAHRNSQFSQLKFGESTLHSRINMT